MENGHLSWIANFIWGLWTTFSETFTFEADIAT